MTVETEAHLCRALVRLFVPSLSIWNHPSCLESTTSAIDADSDLDDDDGRRKRRSASTQLPHPDVPEGSPWYGDMLSASSGYESGRVEDSGKLVICMFLLASALRQGEKVLIFTQSLDMIDLLENVLSTYFGLAKNRGYFRLDGSTSAADRFESISAFNDEKSQARVFVISTKAGCLVRQKGRNSQAGRSGVSVLFSPLSSFPARILCSV